ncbi:MAG: hypothetical protein OXI20_11215 [Rhodospirillales bacterium]|nr:hypothetical protein [Rhodospirillales bacterium]
MRRPAFRKPERRLTSLLVAWMSALSVSIALSPGPEAAAHERTAADAANEPPMVAALRANGARILALGERGGLDGHFVELSDGDAYGLYVTPDGHAIAGLLYGPDGTLLTGRQIATARGESGGGIRTVTVKPASAVAPAGEDSANGGLHGGEVRPGAPVQLAHAYADDPVVPGIETVFERSVSAFGFTLGNAGPAVAVFADPGCRWSRAAVARLAQPALAGRLRLHVVPVGVLGAASAREAAAIASAADPAMAWFDRAPGPAIPEGGRRIERNNALFDAWGAGAVPLIAWRARDGRAGHQVGDIDNLEAWLEALRHE